MEIPGIDELQEAMALDNIYTVLAATGNNHYNSMVCNHYAPHIGRHRVFQPHDAGSDREKHQVPETRRGITAFSQPVSYAEMWTRLIRGWGFRKTSITDSFSEAAFLESLPESWRSFRWKQRRNGSWFRQRVPFHLSL